MRDRGENAESNNFAFRTLARRADDSFADMQTLFRQERKVKMERSPAIANSFEKLFSPADATARLGAFFYFVSICRIISACRECLSDQDGPCRRLLRLLNRIPDDGS